MAEIDRRQIAADWFHRGFSCDLWTDPLSGVCLTTAKQRLAPYADVTARTASSTSTFWAAVSWVKGKPGRSTGGNCST